MGRAELTLVVEDDEAVAAFLTEVIARGGRRVTLARDARAALELLRLHAFSVVTVDVRLPDGEGDAERIVSAARRAGSRVIVISASVEADEIAGRHGVPRLRKPFHVRELEALLVDASATAFAGRR